MRVKKAEIDSLNFTDEHLESLFIHHPNYTSSKVKGKGDIYKPDEWMEVFKKPMGKINKATGKLYFPFIEASIISDIGSSLKFPLKRYAGNPKSQTVEFAGLHGYTERSEILRFNLLELLESKRLDHTELSRSDICIDFMGEVPKGIIKNILKTGRKKKRVGTTDYYTSLSEKKSNPYFDIKIYNKTEQLQRLHGVKLGKVVYRLEFCFKRTYLKGFKGRDINSEKLVKKQEKTIKKVTGKSIKISPFK